MGIQLIKVAEGHRPEDIGQRADERKLLFALANDKLRAISESDLRTAGGARFRSKERSDIAGKRAMAGPTTR